MFMGPANAWGLLSLIRSGCMHASMHAMADNPGAVRAAVGKQTLLMFDCS